MASIIRLSTTSLSSNQNGLSGDDVAGVTTRKGVLWILVGIALYNTTSVVLNKRPYQVFYLSYPIRYPLLFRPDVVIPMFLGFELGPVVGFLSGFIGAAISDYFSYDKLFLNWDIAIGLMGLITSIGYYKVKGTDRADIKGILVLMGLAAGAVVLSVGFAVLVDIYQFSGQATPIEFVPPAITYLANILFLIPIWVVMHEKSVKEHLMTSFSRPRQSEKSE